MADDLQAVGVLVGDDAHTGVVVDDAGGVDQPAVHLAGQRSLGKARSDARGDVRDRNRVIKMSLASVRKGDYRHTGILSKQHQRKVPAVFRARHPRNGAR